MASECPRHKTFVERFRDDRLRLRAGRGHDASNFGFQRGTGAVLVESVPRRLQVRLSWNLMLARRDSIPNHIGTGRVLDPDWVDLDIVRQWKYTCLTQHGAKCENPMKIWPIRPAWLIDIVNKCIVPDHGCDTFVAFGYMCGTDSAFRVNSTTLEKLQVPNELESPDILMHLVPIIGHAMHLTSSIGERYLWVDILCIVHGDDEATAEQ